MSDKFFDKDDNFILWKDEGDLTKASKYVGGRRADLKTNESLTKKIAKGDIEIGREYGWMNKPLTVNWGKCGGNTDVIVTYNSGDALWIPNAFLAQGTNGTSNQPKPDALYLADGVTKDTSVGYKTWFGSNDHDGVTVRQELGNSSGTSLLYINVYKLPQELGEYLYENAESNLGEHLDYCGPTTTTTSTMLSNYKGIAIYPDNPTSWTSSSGWGVGIRKKADIPYLGMLDGEPTYFGKDDGTTDYSAIFNFDQWKALEDDAYYLVAQERGDARDNASFLTGQLQLWGIDDTGTDHIWLRHYNTMESDPSATNKGLKYILPQEMCQQYGIIEKALKVNWGKCGGSTDVIVKYGEGEPLWIPYAFIRNAFDSSLVPKTNTFDKQIGYQGLLGDKTVTGYDEAIYKLPSNIGSYLYANAETGTGYDGNGNSSNLYKGIAFYPDTVSNWEKSSTMGIAIRKKNDIGCYKTNQSTLAISTTVTSNLEDDAYYLVAQINKTTADNIIVLNGHLNSCFPLTSDNGTDHLYLRHWVDMDDVPSATNLGEKYTCPSELCSDNFTLTETKDSITVNWGKCGGNEDVIVNYNVGEGIWIPKDYLLTGFKSDGLPKDYTLDIKDEIGWVARYDADSPTNPVNVYKLPYDFGKWLYNHAESTPNNKYDRLVNSVVYSNSIYKGIATYPDEVSNWSNSHNWGIGIRTATDLDKYCYMSGSPYGYQRNDATLKSKLLEVDPNAYYLVAQVANWAGGETDTNTLYGQMTLFGNSKIYLRHFKDMTVPPHCSEGESSWTSSKDDPTNVGEKYSISSSDTEFLVINHTLPTPNEDQVVIDWGGGIKTYYKYGEPMYIPRAFLEEGITYYGSPNMSSGYEASGQTSNNPAPVKDNIGNHVGYQTWFTENTTDSTRPTTNVGWMAVYRLPNEVGEYLYNRAESSPTVGYYGLGDSESYRVYKEIAIYPNLVNSWDYSEEWTIGIRKKSDIGVTGHTSEGAPYSGGNYVNSDLPQWQALDDNAYYLVAQMRNDSITATSSMYFLSGQLGQAFPKDEFIYLRSFKGMTSKPSSDNMGKGMMYGIHELGGKIFYINSSDNGASYTFYDKDGVKINSWSTIYDLDNAKYYSVKGTPSKDKFYCYYPTKYDSLKWWYNINTTTGATGSAIGTGKTNTATVMARTDIATGTIWSKLSEIRTSSGIDDLFIPSKDEIDKFREADLEPWHRSSGGSYLWSSSESSDNRAWYWNYNNQHWYDTYKHSNYSVFFARAF